MSDDDFFLISSLLQDLTKINNGLSPAKLAAVIELNSKRRCGAKGTIEALNNLVPPKKKA